MIGEVIEVDQIIMIKDPTNPFLEQRSCILLIVILAKSEGLLIPMEPIERQGVDTGVSKDFEKGE